MNDSSPAPTRSAALIALLSVLVGAPLSAQAPVITPDGDPSVSNDTIYSLRVDPADHDEEDAVLLLDDGVLVQEADGTGRRTYRMIAQILTRDGVGVWGEQTFGYDGGRESFRLNWVRVIGPDGEVVSDEPVHVQEMDMPVPEQSPVYTDWKQVRVSLGGVEPGTLVDYSYTVETDEPVRPGDFVSNWLISTGGTVRRSRLVVDVPADYDLRTVVTDATPAPAVSRENGRDVYTWYEEDLAWIEPEHFAAFTESDRYKRVRVGAPSTWNDVGTWYGALAESRYALTDAVRAAAAEAVGDRTGVDALRELYRWVAQDFRYVSVSLGQGSYQPRLPEEVLESRSGDCKDKATLFIALARELGFEARPVLLSSNGGVAEELPSVQQFDHLIAAVLVDSEWVYADLTASIVPFGEIPPGYQGEFGLMVDGDDGVTEVTFPERTASENVTHIRIEGELTPEGEFRGHYVESLHGNRQYGLRSSLARKFTQREIDQVADNMAAGVFDGGRGVSLELFDGLDLSAEVRLDLEFTADGATRPNVGGGVILTLPLDAVAQRSLVTALEDERGRRTMPIDVDQVSGSAATLQEFFVTLPEGWQATLPDGVSVESAFGRYEATYTQEGRELSVRRHFVGATGTEPVSALDDLIAFLRTVTADDVPFLLIDTGTAGEG